MIYTEGGIVGTDDELIGSRIGLTATLRIVFCDDKVVAVIVSILIPTVAEVSCIPSGVAGILGDFDSEYVAIVLVFENGDGSGGWGGLVVGIDVV